MRFWQTALLILLGVGPLGLFAWIGVLWLDASSQKFPMETALRDDPRTPSSLNYALGRVADAPPSPFPSLRPRYTPRPQLAGTAVTPTSSAGVVVSDPNDALLSPEQHVAEISKMAPAQGTVEAVRLLHAVQPEQAQAAMPLYLAYLRDNAIPSRDQAKGVLSLLNNDRLERLPIDESWRTVFAGLMWEAFQRTWADSATSFPAWQAKLNEVNDPVWRHVLEAFGPNSAVSNPGAIPGANGSQQVVPVQGEPVVPPPLPPGEENGAPPQPNPAEIPVQVPVVAPVGDPLQGQIPPTDPQPGQ